MESGLLLCRCTHATFPRERRFISSCPELKVSWADLKLDCSYFAPDTVRSRPAQGSNVQCLYVCLHHYRQIINLAIQDLRFSVNNTRNILKAVCECLNTYMKRDHQNCGEKWKRKIQKSLQVLPHRTGSDEWESYVFTATRSPPR